MMLQRVHMWRNEIKTALEQLGEKTVKFSTAQFKIVRDLATLLHPYKLVVDELQGSTFPTIGQGYYCQFKLAALITGVNTNKVDVNKFGMEVKAVCKILRDQTSQRWNSPTDGTMLATILDPRLKQLGFMSSDYRNKFVDHFRKMYQEMKSDFDVVVTEQPAKRQKLGTVAEYFADPVPQMFDEESEADRYLNDTGLPLNFANVKGAEDPLLWWKLRENKYPILSKAARRYLCIPVSSAASERVWSVGGNILVRGTKRSRMDNERICRMIFVKKNDHVLRQHLLSADVEML
jgi:hypothetical protein